MSPEPVETLEQRSSAYEGVGRSVNDGRTDGPEINSSDARVEQKQHTFYRRSNLLTTLSSSSWSKSTSEKTYTEGEERDPSRAGTKWVGGASAKGGGGNRVGGGTKTQQEEGEEEEEIEEEKEEGRRIYFLFLSELYISVPV